MPKNEYEIIVWLESQTHGYIFTHQSEEAVFRVMKCVNKEEAFCLTTDSDKMMVFAKGKVSHFQITKEKNNA